MRFEAVTLRRFGPFADRTFQFAPGMTVFYGPNEAGKSSVHAALFAGLCGMRRARGQPRDDERVFAARHRPWDGNGWAVSALVVLADGRSIELEQELESKSACRAVDATLGRDCSGEIIFEGTPDGARFLGLDRRVFPAIACVRQADILGVLDNSKHLQEHLQRAAATAGTDATAAAALQRLREFRSTQVGQDVANSNRPLPVARRAVDEAKQRLEKVRDEHDDYLALLVEVERLENARQAAQRALDLFDAALAAQVAEKWQRRLDEARDLLARYPSGPPSNVVADDALAQEVSAALKLWDERPAPEPLSGPTAAELRAQLEALPALPVGDLEPDPAVVEAANALRVATAALEDHQAQAPPEPAEVATGGLSVQDLRDLARDLATPDPPVDPALAARLDQAQRRVEEASRPRRYLGAWLVASVLLVLALLTASHGLLAVLLFLGAVGVALWAVIQQAGGGRLAALEALRAAEKAAGEQQLAAAVAAARREAARNRAQAAGLPTDPDALDALAAALATAEQARSDYQRWQERASELTSAHARARTRLAEALQARGVHGFTDVEAALAEYQQRCDERKRIAAEAARRSSLEEQLRAREQAEALADKQAKLCQAAEAAVRTAAARCGVPSADPEACAAALRAWQKERAATLEARDWASQDWARLQSLLDGRDLAALEAETRARVATAQRLAAPFTLEEVQAVVLEPDTDAQRARLAAALEQATEAWAAKRGQADERAKRLVSVAEAEEALAAAKAEWARVRRLDDTLAKTIGFLERAQDAVHRDIAPVLAASVQRWLPKVTAGRYTGVRVDPASLDVEVRSAHGRWRQAQLLSHGTAEQVYLLLRVALAEHLTRPGEVCPLILDDVTVQCDAERTIAVLETLWQLSQERQVILFTQEIDVLAWAEANLRPPTDRWETLPVVGEG